MPKKDGFSSALRSPCGNIPLHPWAFCLAGFSSGDSSGCCRESTLGLQESCGRLPVASSFANSKCLRNKSSLGKALPQLEGSRAGHCSPGSRRWHPLRPSTFQGTNCASPGAIKGVRRAKGEPAQVSATSFHEHILIFYFICMYVCDARMDRHQVFPSTLSLSLPLSLFPPSPSR